MTNALQGQIGGDHYRKMGMQPFQFTMANGYDPLAHTILKYVARHGSKAGKIDLEKAQHCVWLRLELIDELTLLCRDVIGVLDFCEVNGLGGLETDILLCLHDWCSGQFDEPTHQKSATAFATQISQKIARLIELRYPTMETTL